ncbi:MFS transporter [Rhodococcus sp. LB1]|uniref:MFS transporter n=1 Tax=Rhodococcus sp. LB1 TaxID=1807499 RepID=UPI00077AC7DD|nr:MFS transporter [Rhodococcus sp. LB1]KXX60433.1 hypothetical protein AZG88_37595 [Rhodococcus sp. LB1]
MQPSIQKRSCLVVLGLCFVTLIADGFDLIIYGATLPSLMTQWKLEKSALADVHSLTLLGLMVGFLIAGPLADRFGRRIILLGGCTWFSIACTLCAFAPSFQMFGVARVIAGIGLGSVVPSAVALTAEYAPRARRQLYNGIMLVGYSVGGILASIVALIVLPRADVVAAAIPPDESWRILYGFAALFLVALPIMYFKLPESASYLHFQGRTEEAEILANQFGLDFDEIKAEKTAHDALNSGGGYRLVLSPRFRLATAVFILIMACTQILNYGPNTWLPSMTKEMGFGGVQGTMALMMLQIGAVIGTIVGAILVDRGGATKVIVPYFFIGAISLLTLAFGADIGAVGIFVASLFTGVGTFGTGALMYGVVAAHYPTVCRSSAIGLILGIGRFGAILGPQIGVIFGSPRAGLLAFMVPALLGAALFAFLSVITRPDSRAQNGVGGELAVRY